MIDAKRILYGKEDSLSIVAIDTVPGNIDTLAIYYREGDNVKHVHRSNVYYIYTDLDSLMGLWEQGKYPDYEICNGPNELNVLITPERYEHFKYFRKALPENRCVAVSGPQAFMIKNEVNMFTGLEFDDVARFYFDIEQISTGHFPDPENPDDTVVIISTSYVYKDQVIERVMRVDDYDDEAGMLRAFVAYIRDLDPDILLTYNGLRYDLPVLEARCRIFDVPFTIGRDGSEPYSFSTQIKFAEKETAYTNFNVHGRHCIDVYFLVMYYDVVARELPDQTLKGAAKHFEVAAPNRVYIEGKEITKYWHENREELLKYALDDVRETASLDKILGQSVYYSTQFVPLAHQDVARYGTGTKIESIFTRAYINHKEAYPIPDPKEDFGGGFAYCPIRGRVQGPMSYPDVKSLYPWTRRALGIKPPKDTLGIYAPIMDMLNEERYKNKDLADQYEAEGNPLFESQNAKQNSYKIFINTGNYGFLTWEYTGFNYYQGGALITSTGQEILKEMIRLSDENGYQVYRGDTDGLLVNVKSWEELPEYYAFINKEMKEYIRGRFGDSAGDTFKITNDGEYEKGIVFDGKSYVLVDRKGKLKMKGNTLKSRSMEPFVRSVLKDMVMAILDDDTEMMRMRYYHEVELLMNGKLEFKDLRKRANLKMGRDEYLHKREAGRTHAIAAYEIAYTQDHEIPYRKGDPLEFYVRESGYELVWFKNGNWKNRKIKKSVAELAMVESGFDGNYDKEYYMDRLNKGLKRLLPVFGIDIFSSYFPDVKITKQDITKLEKHGTDDMEDGESDLDD